MAGKPLEFLRVCLLPSPERLLRGTWQEPRCSGASKEEFEGRARAGHCCRRSFASRKIHPSVQHLHRSSTAWREVPRWADHSAKSVWQQDTVLRRCDASQFGVWLVSVALRQKED